MPWADADGLLELPPVDYLRERLSYDPKTGYLYWRSRGDFYSAGHAKWWWNSTHAGKRAGCTNNILGHRTLRMDGVVWQEHRIIWKMYTGREPQGVVRHLNGVRTDNRIHNLMDGSGYRKRRVRADKGGKKVAEPALPRDEYLRECFHVRDGALYWRERPRSHFDTHFGWETFSRQFTGERAGTMRGSVLVVTLDGKKYRAERILERMQE